MMDNCLNFLHRLSFFMLVAWLGRDSHDFDEKVRVLIVFLKRRSINTDSQYFELIFTSEHRDTYFLHQILFSK